LSNRKKTSSSRKEKEEKKGSRKPYAKPSFRHERVFETMALACGKINATQSQCRFNRKSS
jgi:hypothetical protein